MKYHDLRSKTIFDFCTDPSLLEEICVSTSLPSFDKEAFIKDCIKDPQMNAIYLIECAEIIGDNDLKDAVEKEFKNELAEFFSE